MARSATVCRPGGVRSTRTWTATRRGARSRQRSSSLNRGSSGRTGRVRRRETSESQRVETPPLRNIGRRLRDVWGRSTMMLRTTWGLGRIRWWPGSDSFGPSKGRTYPWWDSNSARSRLIGSCSLNGSWSSFLRRSTRSGSGNAAISLTRCSRGRTLFWRARMT